ncbi:hypothetical protein [Stappia sp. ES.058]|uniref:hypothetical protein n=1 Tax=Stappia sp. ES.058 TaxID=1881061 RepID=UPI0018D3468F|nr:hypothetical protein [Stappia sp. ES.058]
MREKRHGHRRFRGGIMVMAALAAPVLLASGAASQQTARSSCTCRYFGQDYHLGETVCLRGPDGMRIARCSMLLNNTTWKPLEEGCPTTRLFMPMPEPLDDSSADSAKTGRGAS